MKFHKEGYPTLILVLIFSAIILSLTYFYLPEYLWSFYLACAVSAFLLITVLQFFRSPKRIIERKEGAILSPCDGKVVVIEETEEEEVLGERRKQISIFMSPINVHNNRYPVSGKLSYFKYHPGKYLVAWHPKSSTDNERTTVVVEDHKGVKILFRQIAGAMARRIVFYGKENDEVKQGDECGFIKFGSRVDLFLPLNAEIKVSSEEKVVAGKTLIATY